MLSPARVLPTVAVSVLAACATKPAPVATAPAPPPDTVRIVDTVRVAAAPDRDLEQRVATLQLQLLGKDAEIAGLQEQLDAAIREVVRSMARMQTLATRAEAASAMAEADVAVQQLETRPGGRSAAEYAQAKRLLEMSSAEFNRQNFGGSVYLANQAKTTAATARGRLAESTGDSLLPDEVRFRVPLSLRLTGRGNVRSGPGTRYGVAFTLERGAVVLAHSYAGQWVRVTDEQGRRGWIFHNLVTSVK
jgi:hypothetical protein